jgi:hypothetical protein
MAKGGWIMRAELQLKKVPATVRSLIAREASMHRRTIDQEAIILLEEALLARAKAQHLGHDQIDEILDRFDKLPDIDARPM